VLQSRNLQVKNLVYYLSRGLCIFTLNHGRDVGRYDAAILYSMVTLSDSLRSLAIQVRETEGAFEYAVHALARGSEVNDEDTGQHISRVGVFIRLDNLKWYDHPFLFKSFKIKDDRQLQTLQGLGLTDVVCVPGKSDLLPLKEDAAEISEQGKTERQVVVDGLWRIKQEHALRLKERQEKIARCEKQYATSQARVSSIMKGIAGGVVQSAAEVVDFAEHFSEYFLEDTDSALHLISAASKDEGIYYHSMNVTVLAMMLGKQVGVTSEEMKILCQGALLHDVGKSRIDKKVVLKEKGHTKPELNFLQLHPKYGVEILASLPNIPRAVLTIVYQHHEACDGSGYPQGITGPQIHTLSKIVSIANAYDVHCNKRNAADCLTPFEALSHMFSVQKTIFDEKLLASFIHCLGIYPPGTIVQLNNGSIGMVICVNPESQLQPGIVLYDPEIPKKDALIIDMQDEPDLKIAASIRPAALPPEIFDYLSPRSRITYFVDTKNEPGAAKPL
jgi:putative nucleotidyltransferase with HDIG domain